ncbi:MAG: Permease of the drug/metabolite transporter superfamily, partial [Bryobacterales bacterium]|nr:Permease of the drug/metabolite transporter superfamily [Bryobacterales bacterium]
MEALQVTAPSARLRIDPMMALCFFAVYVIWGSTYLAIRLAVADVPPVFAAGVRFVIAGVILFLWSKRSGTLLPTSVQWRNIGLLGGLMFLVAYSCVFWAETRIPSGITAVLVATAPIWTTLLEVFAFKEMAWRVRTRLDIARGELNVLPCLAVLLGSMSWSLGSV